MKRVAIIDYGLANLRSVLNAFNCFPVDITLAERGADLTNADAIVLPGVGSFDRGMANLEERGHLDALNRRVREAGVPLLGICLGLQFLLQGSDEGNAAGLGWLPGHARRFPEGLNGLKVPHMGWNTVHQRPCRLFSGLEPAVDFYFVHSYYLPREEGLEKVAAGICSYGPDFVAAVEFDNIAAVQFHPEKSQLAGMKMLETFLDW